jgi:hypothetical protein
MSVPLAFANVHGRAMLAFAHVDGRAMLALSYCIFVAYFFN